MIEVQIVPLIFRGDLKRTLFEKKFDELNVYNRKSTSPEDLLFCVGLITGCGMSLFVVMKRRCFDRYYS